MCLSLRCWYKGDTRADSYRLQLAQYAPVISFITVAEIEVWARRRSWGEVRLKQLEEHLANYPVSFADLPLCRICALVTVEALQQGRPISTGDAWIAATALLLNAPLVTHNVADFSMVRGLSIITQTSL